MIQSAQSTGSDSVHPYTENDLEAALKGFDLTELRQLAVYTKNRLRAQGSRFRDVKKQIDALKIRSLSGPTIERLTQPFPSHQHQESQFHELFQAFLRTENVQIRRAVGAGPVELLVSIQGVEQPPFRFQEIKEQETVHYQCFYYNIHKRRVLSGRLTLSKKGNGAALELPDKVNNADPATHPEASGKPGAGERFEGKWQAKDSSTVFVDLIQSERSRNRNRIDLILSGGPTQVFAGVAAAPFSLNDPHSFLLGTFSTLYTLPKEYGAVPSVGLMLLKPGSASSETKDADLQQISYFLSRKVIAPPDEETTVKILNGWAQLAGLTGHYLGYYINTSGGELHRFSLTIDASGRASLNLPADEKPEEATSPEEQDQQVDAPSRFINGQVRIIGNYNQLLSLHFDFQRMLDQYRFRFLFKIGPAGGWHWGHGSGLGNDKSQPIITSRTAIRRVGEPVEPVIFPLSGKADFEIATGEDSAKLLDFFVGETEQHLTEAMTVARLKGTVYKTGHQAPRFTGLFRLYSLERRWIRDPKKNVNIRRYLIVKYPFRIDETGTAWIGFSKDSDPVETQDLQWGDHYLAVTFRMNDGSPIPGTKTDYIQFVFWYQSASPEDLTKLMGLSIRRGNAPEARVELLMDYPSAQPPAPTDRNYPFGDLTYEDVITDTTDTTYQEWTDPEENPDKLMIINYLSGKINRLILLPVDTVTQKNLQLRQKEHRRIYFFQACYQAMRGHNPSAVIDSLIRAHRHGFGTDEDDIQLLEKELVLFKAEYLEKTINQLWPGVGAF
ncbi:hypothetical protein [Larkinella soli]|uniref:hypothetical protein n=1 Tax=Larkinella soli TaxID=1770527 RepID=UPI000FFC88E3|nr:hypothetical protein [Larkinella soli]